MRVSYGKLFKLLVDRQIRKMELCQMANVSTAAMAKLTKGQNLTVDVLVRICTALDCKFDDIMELLPEIEATEDVSGGDNK